jgi:hypothetical protein
MRRKGIAAQGRRVAGMDYLRAWIRNLFYELLVIIALCIFMLIFMKIFYPEALSFFFLVVQGTVQPEGLLKLVPLAILMVLVYALPPRAPRANSRYSKELPERLGLAGTAAGIKSSAGH